MSDTYIKTGFNGLLVVGEDATLLYRAMACRSAIKLHMKTGIVPSRGVTITKMFATAASITGGTYKRGQHQKAIDELTIWIDTMKCAIPVVDERTGN